MLSVFIVQEALLISKYLHRIRKKNSDTATRQTYLVEVTAIDKSEEYLYLHYRVESIKRLV